MIGHCFMGIPWKTCAFSLALRKALGGLSPGAPPLVVPYGENSETLWSLTDSEVHQELAELVQNGMILIWDRSVSGSPYAERINTADYLTPVTWAVCAQRRFPHLRVAVIDCDASTHCRGKFYRIVQMIAPDRSPLHLITDPTDCVSECLAFLEVGTMPKASQDCLEILIHQLRTILTERGPDSDRHALANIVGPLILMGSEVEEAPRKPQHALLTLFRELGLGGNDRRPITPSPPVQHSSAEATAALLGPSQAAHPLRLLLVDDQWDQGWDAWVSKMLAERPGCRLEKTRSPTGLIEALEAAFDRAPDVADLRFRLAFPGIEGDGLRTEEGVGPAINEEETILLLDLRLFSLQTAETEAEFVFDRLLPLCQHFKATREDTRSSSTVGWPQFSPDELGRVESWCLAPERGSDDHLLVLSLLPRLLALADFSLPIVLFSSTGQRRIIELLKPYRNIITDFEKPRFTGLETDELVAITEERFTQSIRKAESLLAARQRCRSAMARRPDRSAREQSAERSVRYVELFIDEQDWLHPGATHFCVGGCFSVFEAENLSEAQAKANRFDDHLVQRGVRYFHSRGVGPSPHDGQILSKRTDLSSFFAGHDSLPDAPLQLGAVRLRIAKGAPGMRPGALANPRGGDNRYFLALKALLELFLCESIPALAGERNAEDIFVSIFPATRVVSIENSYQDHAIRSFGLKRVGTSRELFYSLDRAQLYPLVDDILDSRRVIRKTFRVLAVQLPYDGNRISLPEFFICYRCGRSVQVRMDVPDDALDGLLTCGCGVTQAQFRPDYRALHYLADELLGQFPEGSGDRDYDALFSDPVPGEFDELLDSHLAATLEAGRRLDAGDLVGALESFEEPAQISGGPRADVWFCERLSRQIPLMKGEDVLRLAGRLRAEMLLGEERRA